MNSISKFSNGILSITTDGQSNEFDEFLPEKMLEYIQRQAIRVRLDYEPHLRCIRNIAEVITISREKQRVFYEFYSRELKLKIICRCFFINSSNACAQIHTIALK
jgi:hypothetical protein